MLTIKALAEILGGVLEGAGSEHTEIRAIAAIDKAGAHEASFIVNPEYAKFAPSTKAGVVIVGRKMDDCPRPQIVHKNPYWAFAKTSQMFASVREELKVISDQAFVAKSVKIGKNVTIYPFVYVSDGCELSDDVVLFPGVYLGREVKIGKGTILRASVSVEDRCVVGERVLIHANTAIGADGFGFAPGDEGIAKIPQVGIVRIGDDVEIGGGSTIDRAAMGETVIGKGVKIDSSVHVAHNVQVGSDTMLCGGVFIAGSAKIGSRSILAGCASVAPHVSIGDGVTIGGLGGVTKSIKEPGEYMGFPAIPAGEWRRQIASMRRLKHLEERLRRLEAQLESQGQKS